MSKLLIQCKNQVLCQIIAAALLYFILASFTWMLIEGYQLYQMVILVFSNVGHLPLKLMHVIGYGTPSVMTLIVVAAFKFKCIEEQGAYLYISPR